MPTFFLSLSLLALLMFGSAAHAQTAIHHCVDANGTPVFTDRACASLDAQPAVSSRPAHPRGPQRCPRDRNALRERITAAFRHHNANALAGLMLWRGYDQRAATATLARLAHLVTLPFQGFANTDGPAQSATALPPWPPASAASAVPIALPPAPLTINLGDIATPQITFVPIAHGGCLWLAP